MEFKAFASFDEYIPCDALVSCLFIHPGFVTKASEWHVAVELCGKETRGQFVLDHLKSNKNNAKIVERVDAEDLKTLLLWVVGDPAAEVKIIV